MAIAVINPSHKAVYLILFNLWSYVKDKFHMKRYVSTQECNPMTRDTPALYIAERTLSI